MVKNQYSSKFKIASNQEASLKAWEEENEEYVFWNLILDKKVSLSCQSGKHADKTFFMTINWLSINQ